MKMTTKKCDRIDLKNVKNKKITYRIRYLLYVANILSLAPFVDFATNDVKWKSFGRFLNCVTISYGIYNSYYILSTTIMWTTRSDIVINGLLVINYMFQACLIVVSITYTIFRTKKFIKLLKMLQKLEDELLNNSTTIDDFFRKLFAFSVIIIAISVLDFLWICKSGSFDVTFACALLLSFVFVYHTLLILYVTFVKIASIEIEQVNESIKNLNVVNNNANVYILTKRALSIYDNLNYLIKLINEIFELPLLLFLLVFASNILIFIHVSTLKSYKLYGISFYLHDIVSITKLKHKGNDDDYIFFCVCR